jgi:hypothetical protein
MAAIVLGIVLSVTVGGLAILIGVVFWTQRIEPSPPLSLLAVELVPGLAAVAAIANCCRSVAELVRRYRRRSTSKN